ncbi:dihydrolipoamide acetyltransferase family protein [Leucobacter komagatae]|uniref:Dihydrolipoamide acetyltransferase component of pyruvate dehydrogenase complex n=1 Tax=Leucobacter komagatae TaxID=55969 RepID=A0A0D0IP07_9MICO|nr:dihydrolipoamide acetyltransferase family protein [Leucobacter komagatae]KIP53294.1 branched-chain alpha-keto acid dehydrogenase subunit E2 [Leucobacter komagatae]
MSNNEFALPDVGEGLTEAEIVSWAVKPGDTVELNQVICEIETAKSLVEIPSPFEGEIAELLVETGTTVPVGTAILRMVGDGDGGDAAPAGGTERATAPADAQAADSATGQVADTAAAPAAPAADDEENSGAVLVGYGTGGAVKSRRRPGGQPVISVGKAETEEPPVAGKVYVKPPVRKLAKDLGVDLARVPGSGAGGEILRDDVLAAANGSAAPSAAGGAAAATIHTPASGFGAGQPREERIPVKGIRKVVAQAMVASKFSAPHTSVFVEVDATRTMKLVRRMKASDTFAGVRVSPMLIMAKAIIWALARNPEVNSAWGGDEIIRRNYVNLGIAAATPRGLVVPNIRDAHQLSLVELAEAIGTLTQRARDGLTQPAEMQQGTITLTNVGVFGVDFGLPILNPGETAIVAMGSIKEKPWVVKGKVKPRMVTTVGGSFDHRVIDGDVISRFVSDIAAALERPELLIG